MSPTEVDRVLQRLLDDAGLLVKRSTTEEAGEVARLLNKLVLLRDQEVGEHTRELKRSEGRLRNIIETTPVGICITGADGLFQYVNPNYCRLYGYAKDELIGRHFTIVVPPENREHLSRLHDEFMGRRWELNGEWTVRRRNGEAMTILANAAYIIDVDGEPKKVTFVVDITAQKRAETELRETVRKLNEEIERRERVEKMKDGVERIIRHDLRNPLHGIIGAAQLLMEDQQDNELVGLIYESARNLDQMLNSSLDLVRMEDGTYQLTPSPVDLLNLIRTSAIELSGMAKTRGCEIIVYFDRQPARPGMRAVVKGERVYLGRVFSNLIRNAVEASPDGGTIRVDLFPPSPDEGNPGVDRATQFYRVEVHNMGSVPESVRPIFFERYATAGKRNGSGIGTYVAKLVTEIHGGSISFSTSDEEGTTLHVRLPLEPPPTAGAE